MIGSEEGRRRLSLPTPWANVMIASLDALPMNELARWVMWQLDLIRVIRSGRRRAAGATKRWRASVETAASARAARASEGRA